MAHGSNDVRGDIREKAEVALAQSLIWKDTLNDGVRVEILEAALREIAALAFDKANGAEFKALNKQA